MRVGGVITTVMIILFTPYPSDNLFFFDCRNVFGMQNHERKCESYLEKEWVKKYTYFSLVTTLFGIVTKEERNMYWYNPDLKY